MISLYLFAQSIYANKFIGESFPIVSQSDSIFTEFLTEELYSQLKWTKDNTGYTFQQLISQNRGEKQLKNPNIESILAGSSDSYRVFAPFLDKIIQKHHNFDGKKRHVSDWDISSLNLIDINQKQGEQFILCTRISISRNIEQYPFLPNMSYRKRKQVEKLAKKAFSQFEGPLKGKYYNLSDPLLKSELVPQVQNLIYKDNGNWTSGRGVFVSDDKELVILINENDQFKIVATQKSGDLKKTFEKVYDVFEFLSRIFQFAYSTSFGSLTSSPAILGTAMNIQFEVKLPYLGQEKALLMKKAKGKRLSVVEKEGDVFIIQNTITLGLNEEQLIKETYEAINYMIQEEKYARSSRYN